MIADDDVYVCLPSTFEINSLGFGASPSQMLSTRTFLVLASRKLNFEKWYVELMPSAFQTV